MVTFTIASLKQISTVIFLKAKNSFASDKLYEFD